MRSRRLPRRYFSRNRIVFHARSSCACVICSAQPATRIANRGSLAVCPRNRPGNRARAALEELACRLGTLTIHLPPLRERRDDLPRLTERLLERVVGKRRVTFSPAAWETIRTSPWPRNLAELFEGLVGAVARSSGDRIEADDLPLYLRLPTQPVAAEERPLPLQELLEGAERRLITLALRRAGGNKSRAAESLGIWRTLLLRRMTALGIPDPTPPRKASRKSSPEEAD